MAFFNSFQLSVLLLCWPFIIQWLATKPFAASGALYWVSIVAFVVHFVFNLFAVASMIDKR